MDECERQFGERRLKAEGASTDQARSFAILRRAQCSDDLVPSEHGDPFDRGFIGRCGLNAELARRATTPEGDVWIVPGNGSIALHTGSTTWAPTEVVARQGLLMWGSGAKRPEILVHGLVPDGVTEVTLVCAEGPPATLPVTNNVFGPLLRSQLRSARFEGPAGTVERGPRDA